jgi:hypothetical protein
MTVRPSYALRALVLTAISSVGAAGAFAALGVSAPGCTVLTNDAPLDDAGTFEGGDAGPSTTCTSCVTQECTGAWSVCLTDSRCVALRACDNPFGESEAARNQCFCDRADASAPTADAGVTGADPLAAYAAFASCNDARTCGKCASDCTSQCANGGRKTTAGSCGAPADDGGSTDDAATDPDASGDAGDAAAEAAAPEVPSADRCATCVSDRCGDPKKACALGSECSLFLACAYACTDVACVDACGKAHSTGKQSATELSNCTLTSCRSACGY